MTTISNRGGKEDNKGEETDLTELEAWLYFIGSDRLEHIGKVLASDPKFAEMYREIEIFRLHPEEAIGMFSEALRKLDENTVTYMIEEMKQELEEKDKKLEESTREIERLRRLLAEKEE